MRLVGAAGKDFAFSETMFGWRRRNFSLGEVIFGVVRNLGRQPVRRWRARRGRAPAMEVRRRTAGLLTIWRGEPRFGVAYAEYPKG